MICVCGVIGYYGRDWPSLLNYFLQHISLSTIRRLVTTGAVGTPLWFGFAPLQLSDEDLVAISYRSSIAMMIASLILLPWVSTVLIPFAEVKKNLIFLYLSIFSVMGPLVGFSLVMNFHRCWQDLWDVWSLPFLSISEWAL